MTLKFLIFLIPLVLGIPVIQNLEVTTEKTVDPDYNIPEVQDAPEIPYEERDSPTHAYSVDIGGFHTTSYDMECLREKGYKAVFIRAFNPVDGGFFDREVVNTVHNAFQAGIGSEVYITPQINSSRNGGDQISLVYQNLHDNGIAVRSIWIQVTSPSNWNTAPMPGRVQFIQDMIRRAKDLGLSVGIYTSFYDWLEITGGWNIFPSDVFLWYWHILGFGASGESEATLDDFRPFGPWRSASVKQFAQVEKVCGMIVNRNVYAIRNQQKSNIVHFKDNKIPVEKSEIKVGGIGF